MTLPTCPECGAVLTVMGGCPRGHKPKGKAK